ncbi:hypothetical protein PshuTeo2_36500 [Pseudomonas hunanensis]|uniref:hypothetical protein n=1 Tax=Pseudomonas TaxID=286 RepID=UPI002AA0E14C|nr:hypothetical protein [Pseudomonas hunanensis]MDY7073518.1 hypothetical protein [Pseudomonas hunanensis]
MDLQTIKDQIPYYLTKPAAEGLLRELENYNAKTDFYTSRHPDEFLQGDGWRGFEIYDFTSKQGRTVRGIVLSNSCDISPENKRDIPAKVSFVPIIKLDKIKKLFEQAGLEQKSIDSKVQAIREQKNTSFFFLPAQGTVSDEYVAWLSDVHSMPTSVFLEGQERSKLFTLNLTGFYLFLLKLSIHFCRFHEEVDRSAMEVTQH